MVISLRDRIFEKCDNKQNLKALVRCINWFGTEDKSHPGLNDLISKGDMILSGKP